MDIRYKTAEDGIKLCIQKPRLQESVDQFSTEIENSNSSLLKIEDCKLNEDKKTRQFSSSQRQHKIRPKHSHLVKKEKIHSASSINMISCTIEKPSREHSSEDTVKSERKRVKHKRSCQKPDRKPGVLSLCVTDLAKPYEEFKEKYCERDTDSFSVISSAVKSINGPYLDEECPKRSKKHKHRHRDSSLICARQLVQVARLLNDEDFRNKILKDKHNEKRKRSSKKSDSTPSDEQAVFAKHPKKDKSKKERGSAKKKHKKDKTDVESFVEKNSNVSTIVDGDMKAQAAVSTNNAVENNFQICLRKKTPLHTKYYNPPHFREEEKIGDVNDFMSANIGDEEILESKPIMNTLLQHMFDGNASEQIIALTYSNKGSKKNKKYKINKESSKTDNMNEISTSGNFSNNKFGRTKIVNCKVRLRKKHIVKMQDECCQSSFSYAEYDSNIVSDATEDYPYQNGLVNECNHSADPIREKYNELIGDNAHNQSSLKGSSLDLVLFPASEMAIQNCANLMQNEFNSFNCGDKIRCKDNDIEINRRIQHTGLLEHDITENETEQYVIDYTPDDSKLSTQIDKDISSDDSFMNTNVDKKEINVIKPASTIDDSKTEQSNEETSPQTCEDNSSFGCLENSISLDKSFNNPITNVLVMQCTMPLPAQSPHHIYPKALKSFNANSKVLECDDFSIIVDEDRINHECKVILAAKQNNSLSNYVEHSEADTKVIAACPSHIELKPVCAFTTPVRMKNEEQTAQYVSKPESEEYTMNKVRM